MRTDLQPEPLRDIVARLIEAAKAYAHAEVAVLKQTVTTRVTDAVPAIVMVVAAIFLLQAALTGLVVALGMLLAIWTGPAAGMAIAALVTLALAGLLVWLALGRFRKVVP